MRFFRQTLLSVCLILPFAVWGQPVATDDTANTDEDAAVSFNVLTNDPGPGIDPATVDLDVSTVDVDNFFSVSGGEFTVDALGEVTFSPTPDFAGVVTLLYTVQNSHDDALTSNQALITVNVAQVNDVPVISSILVLVIDEDTQTAGLQFTVSDIETTPEDLTVTASSGNIGLVPVSNIVFGGSGPNRTVQITPLPNQNGNVLITLTVSDGTDTQQTSFTLTVNAVNDLPSISGISDQSISQNGQTGLLAFTVNDLETAPASLSVTASSGNVILVPNANIELAQNGGNWTVQVTPSLNETGITIITLTVNDGNTGTAQTTFQVTVNAVANTPPTITSITNQTINEDTQTAALQFTVGDAETAPGDLTVTASSGNTGLVPVSNIVFGGSGATRTVQITPLADQNGDALITLTVSDGTDTQQTSFTLAVNPINDLPSITSISNQVINVNTSTALLPFSISDLETAPASLSVTGTSDNVLLFPDGNILIAGSGSNKTVQVTPDTDEFGTATITLTVNDGSATTQTSFQITVNDVSNSLPTITAILNQVINEDTPTAALNFIIGDVETPVGSLLVTATSDNIVLVPNSNINIGGTGANRTVQVTPDANQNGIANFTLTVDDGEDVVQTVFRVTVNAINDSPTITSITAQTINEDSQTGAIPFVVGDLESSPGSLTVSGSSGNTALVPNINIVVTGSGANRFVTITPLPVQNGVSIITLTVSDGTNNSQTAFQVTVDPVDDTPTIASIPDQTIAQNTQTGPLSFAIDDKETPATLLQLTPASSNTVLVQNSNIVLGGAGSLRNVNVIPSINQIGITTISLTVSDGANTALTAFQVMVTDLDAPPTITLISDQVINEDGTTGAITFTVGDPDTGPVGLMVTGVSDNPSLVPNLPANISLVEGVAGSWTVQITSLANQSGMANITLTVTDGVETADISFNVTVTAVNDLPTITPVAAQGISEDSGTGPLAFTIGDLETPLGTLVVTRTSSNTTLVPLANVVLGGSGSARTVTVTPALNQFGTTTITLTVNDGTASVNTAFLVTVSNVNDLPTITNVADQAIDEDSPGTGALAFTVGDVETPAGTLTVTRASSNTTLIPLANVVLGGSAGSRTVTVTPAANQFGTSTITLTVSDGTASVDTDFLVTVTGVNDPPTITAISNQVINEDAPGGTGLLAFTIGDPETAPGSLVLSNTSSNLTLVPAPNVVFGGSGASRTVRVTPALNQFGTTTITMTVSDGTLTSNTAFDVTVNAVNDVPTITVISSQIIDENTSTGALAFTVDDVETAPGSLTVTRASSNTTLAPLANVVLGGSGGNRTVNITPAPNENGVTTITVTVSDGTASTPITFDVNVNGVNDAPTITAIADQVINEDVSTSALSFTVGDPETPAGSLTVSGSSSNTTVIPNANISFGGSGASRTVTVTPAADQSGVSTITINVSDGVNTTPETFVVTVNAVNDAPTITAIANQTINEDTQTGALVFTIGDAETAAASLIVTASSSNVTLVPNANILLGGTGPTRTVNVTPDANQSGVTVITVNVSDGVTTVPRTFQVTVTAVNDAPTITAIAPQVIAEDTPTSDLAFTIGDVETPVGSLTVSSSSSNTTLVPIANIVLGGSGASRTVRVTPANNQTGTTTITLSVDDGTASTDTDFLITVTGVNDPPTISNITDRTINEDAQTGNINFTISDPESAATTLVVTGSSSNTTLVPDANITLGGTGTTRTVNVIPAANQFGITTITLNVSDGTSSTPETFTVTVNSVNDVPIITNQVTITVNEVQPVVLSLPQLTVVDPDNTYPDDFTLLVLGGANYTITGLTTITPFPNFSGVLTVPVFVSDGTAFSPIFNLQIAVNSTNDAPVITGQTTLTINEDQTIMLQLTDLTVTDPDNTYPDDFTLTVLAGANYTFSGNTVTPAANYNGTLSVSVKVNDGSADSAPFNVQITITPVNDPPVITAQSPLSTNEDTPLTLVIGNFTVTDPEPTTYTLSVSQTPGPNYTVSGNTITPALDFSGVLTVPVTASDGVLNSAVFNAQITVNAVNDAPIITGQVPLTTVEDIPLTITLADLTVTDVDNTFPTGFSLTVQAGTNYTFSGNTITPTLDFVGDVFVNVTVSDGTTSSAPFVVLVDVTDDSDAPVITGQNPVTMNEDQTRTIVVGDLLFTDPDTAPDQQTLTVLAGTNYTITGNTIAPSANFFGTLSVNVRLFDGQANSNIFQLQVTVNPVNDAPSFNAISNITILEDAAQQTITITGISPGPLESQPLLITMLSDNTAVIPQPVNTPTYNGTATSTTFTFKPEPNTFGTANITVRVVDTDFASFERTFTITVTSVNDAPTLAAVAFGPIIEDAPEQIIPLTGITPGGGPSESVQVLSIILSTNKPEFFDVFEAVYANPTTTGSIRILPKANVNGTAQITVRVQDDGPGSPAPNVNFTTRTFDLVITSVNDLPAFVSEAETITEPGKLYTYLVDVIDADGDVITLTAPEKPAWLNFILGTNGKATMSGTPPALTSGDFTVVIVANDPSGTPITQEFTINVNSRPTLTPVAITIEEDATHSFDDAEFAAGFSDTDGNPIAKLEITQLPKRGLLRFNNTAVAAGAQFAADELGSLTYTPNLDETRNDTLRWNAADGFDLFSLTDTYAILRITPVNDPPVITVMELETDTLKYELGSEIPVLLTPTFVAVDPDGDNITSAEIGFRRSGTYQFRADNDLLIFQPTAKISGTYNEAAGILSLSGTATPAEYSEAIRSIRYDYVDARDLSLLDTRSVYISLNDDKGATSLQRARVIQLIFTFSDLNIPSAFTPNVGDDVNQTWVISAPNGTDQFGDAEIKVYNKRGVLLYETRGFEKPWNGVWNGEVLPPDTYYYTIDLNYNRVRYKGTVTLLR